MDSINAERQRRMKPIIMSTESVKAIMDGRKTMMRRVCKPEIEHDVVDIKVMQNGDWTFRKYIGYRPCNGHDISGTICRPPYKSGDVLQPFCPNVRHF